MTNLEREIIEKFYQLDRAAQQRVRAIIDQPSTINPIDTPFDYEAWFSDIEAIREQIRADQHGTFPSIDVVALLRDMRDGVDE